MNHFTTSIDRQTASSGKSYREHGQHGNLARKCFRRSYPDFRTGMQIHPTSCFTRYCGSNDIADPEYGRSFLVSFAYCSERICGFTRLADSNKACITLNDGVTVAEFCSL